MVALALTSEQWRIVSAVIACVLIEGIDLQILGFAAPALLADWHLTKAAFASAMGASLLGMAVGAPISGRLADGLGRRPLVIACLGLLGGFTALTAFAVNVGQIALLRLCAGLCFGAILTNAPILAAEWMPKSLQDQTVALVVVGTPVGGMLGAAAASWVIPNLGWRAAFIGGGVLPCLAAVCLRKLVQESPQFLAARSSGNATAGIVSKLIGLEYLRSTAGVCLAFGANLAIAYAFFSWVPTLLVTIGVPLAAAIRGLLYFNLCGALMAVVASRLIARTGLKPFLIVAAAVGMAALLCLAMLLNRAPVLVTSAPWILALLLSLIGAANVAAQAVLFSLAARIYPVQYRATGMGLAGSAGRWGGLCSSVAGGPILGLAEGPIVFLALNALLFLVTATGVALVDRQT